MQSLEEINTLEMDPGLLSTLLPTDSQKETVNLYNLRHFQQPEMVEMVSYNKDKADQQPEMIETESHNKGKAEQLCEGEGMHLFVKERRFYPQLHVDLTLPNRYLKNSKAKPRLKWETELQDRFIRSIEALGGEEHATPKKILYMMNVKGVTLSHLKSHLQKYRMALKVSSRQSQLKKTSSQAASFGNHEPPNSTETSGANKWKAESSEADQMQNGNKPLKFQDVKMDDSSMTMGNQSILDSTIQSMGNQNLAAYVLGSENVDNRGPLGTNIFNIQFQNYYPPGEFIVDGRNVDGSSMKEQTALHQPLDEEALINQSYYSTVDSYDLSSMFKYSNETGANDNDSLTFSKPMECESDLSSMFVTPKEPASIISHVTANPTGQGSMTANSMGSSSCFPIMEPDSSFSSTVANAIDPGLGICSGYEASLDTGASSLSSTFGNSLDSGSSSSLVMNPIDPKANVSNPEDNGFFNGDFALDSGDLFMELMGMFP